MQVGLNTEILDIKLGVYNEMPGVIAKREKLIKKLVKKKATIYDGRAFNFIVTTMANGPHLFESTRVQVE